MSGINKRVHIVPTSLDEDRLEGIFEVRPDYVYVIFNGTPIEEHEELAEETRQTAVEIAENYVHDVDEDIRTVGIDFYHFENALADTYRILYREKLLENEVYVNLSGGTKPVAVALAVACSLTKTGDPYYYAAEDYTVQDGKIQTKGMIDESYTLSQLTSLDFSNTIPDGEESRNIVRWLFESEEAMGITELLEYAGELQGIEDGDERKRVAGPYYNYAGNLVDTGLLEKPNSDYKLTPAGELVGRLLTVQREVEETVNAANIQ